MLDMLRGRSHSVNLVFASLVGGLCSVAVLWLCFPVLFNEVRPKTILIEPARDCYCLMTTGSSSRTTYMHVTLDELARDRERNSNLKSEYFLPSNFFCSNLVTQVDREPSGEDRFEVGSFDAPCHRGPFAGFFVVWFIVAAAIAIGFRRILSSSAV
jgi:hypothetical protein